MQPQPGLLVTHNVRLSRPLGAGGMGTVWLAEHLGLRAPVVVKFISDALAHDPAMLERFSREAAAAYEVRHPNVVQMLDHGSCHGRPFIVMELLEGEDLAARLARRGRLPPLEILPIVEQTARALARMHERGIVHRDIKAENLFLCNIGGGEEIVKVLDLGIAKRATESGDMPNVTRAGSVIGSPHTMSPEQVTGQRVDARADIWALGVVVFQALTGARPFDGSSPATIMVAIANAEIPAPSRYDPSLPPSIDAWFFRACARDPAARFSNAREMAEAFRAALRSAAVAPTDLAPQTERSLPGTNVAPGGRGLPGTVIASTEPSLHRAPAAPVPYIPPTPDEDDGAPERRSSIGLYVVLVLVFAGIALGVYAWFHPHDVEAAWHALRDHLHF